jgi:hypothetical protein
MKAMDGFWAEIDRQLEELRTARTVEDVMRVLAGDEAAEVGFFAGGGGDGSVYEALMEAGWSTAWWEAGYFWAARCPDNRGGITYVEGDIIRGVQKPGD